MSDTGVKKAEEGCCLAGHGSILGQGGSESKSDNVISTTEAESIDDSAVDWEGLKPESKDARWAGRAALRPSRNRSIASILSPPETPQWLVSNDSIELGETKFYTLSESVARRYDTFTGQLDELNRTESPRTLTTYLSVPRLWHNTSEVDLDQMIGEAMDEGRWRRNQTPRPRTVLAPVSPNIAEASTPDRYLASPFCWPDSETIWRLGRLDREENWRVKRDLETLKRADEMSGYRRTLAASWALASVVAWEPEGPVRLGIQMSNPESEHEQSAEPSCIAV
ncbi:uncharacterized protein Z519_10380 [Cladophialophora bantiana CBS 173.52]|uniref:Uncharacterized protein n=1 Tax=Cladophialophora bantiana (strain ATCC 10958 / CBS 173.52 / CDC B-1940 / NIH 8579) TaxID=1442370 RepID=A0A0D2EFR9_CLAB1|nr:uncharacterized protein Z519_10380 [Cladophialophora bantiana CBS 173.52]KIW88896.1 hypothetical protein Z519_10380 [Cladophialophora bantiana CBS 173.52]